METNYPENDNQYHEVKVKSVETGGFTGSDGWSFFVPKESKVQPKIGMIARFYGKGIGFTVRGLFLDGQKVFYRTETQQKIDDENSLKAEQEKRQKELDDNRTKIDERYNKLPEVFRQRIDKFRRTNPNFRRDYESYELFCCEQAVIFAEHFKSPEILKIWHDKPYEEQLIELPALSKEHSGNTFGCAYGLAYQYLTNPQNVVLMHGALTPIVGCKEYGCPH